MIFKKTDLTDFFIIIPEPFRDYRGYFGRIFCKRDFKEIGLDKEMVQINLSLNKKKSPLRGMHFQCPPKTEIKIIQHIKGSVFDVAVDLRKNSSTFLKWHGEILSEDNLKMIFIPEGFADGFQSLSDNTQFLYLHTEFYSSEHESGISYNDPRLNNKWPLEISLISEIDKNHTLIDEGFEGLEI